MEALSPQSALIPLTSVPGLSLELPPPLESQAPALERLIADLELRLSPSRQSPGRG